MKICPVCDAVAFDDAAQCFGCLHEFSERDAVLEVEQEPTPHVRPNAGPAPEFLIRFTPLVEPSGSVTWSCAVEEPSAI